MSSEQQPWVDGPFPLVSTKDWKSTNASEHASVHIALEMARAHNVIIRGLNAIYLQGAYVKNPQDIADFLFFCNAWVITVNHHHEAEEQFLFPDLQALSGKPYLMAENLDQHKVFHDGLEQFEAYIKDTKPEDYNWSTFKAVIDSFAPALLSHLGAEIPTMLALHEYDDEELRKVWARTEKFAANMGDASVMAIVVPFALGCIDRDYEDGLHKNFPPLPFFVPPFVDWWVARKHRGAWRFLPCDFYRKRRPLAFPSASL